MTVVSRPFRLLCDHPAVYDFLCEIFATDWCNGVPAPFVEYAMSSDWMDISLCHRWRIWEEDKKMVGFCFTENPASHVYFCLRPGYDFLAAEMIRYAREGLKISDEDRRLVLLGAQKALVQAAEEAGYCKDFSYWENCYFFDTPLERTLPEGYRFTAPGEVDAVKAEECCWKGFDHEAEEGPWNGECENGLKLITAPHFTPECIMAVVDEEGNYACYGGMWWTPQNRLAYLEPLCTVPGHRKKGLAAALLSEMARRMKAKGAVYMTGGGDVFYQKIGFRPAVEFTYWRLKNEK